MRINEIASAEEQIELWKLVSNSVWQSLQQQEREEQQRKATEASARKKAPNGGGRTKGARTLPTVLPPPNPKQAAQQKSNAAEPTAPNALAAGSARSNAAQQPASMPKDSRDSVKTAGFQSMYGQQKSDDDTDDRHSKNTLPRTIPNSAVRR